MTKGITDMLNLPPLDEVLKKQGIDVHAAPEKEESEPSNEVSDEDVQKSVANLRDLSARMAMLEGTDHGEAMDVLHDEILAHARELMAYGFNIDMPRQRGIFEIAASMYGHAMSAKNSKRDAQLKALKLALDRRRTDMEEKRTNHAIGQGQAATFDEVGTIVVEDRNELIKRLRAQMKNQSES